DDRASQPDPQIHSVVEVEDWAEWPCAMDDLFVKIDNDHPNRWREAGQHEQRDESAAQPMETRTRFDKDFFPEHRLAANRRSLAKCRPGPGSLIVRCVPQ